MSKSTEVENSLSGEETRTSDAPIEPSPSETSANQPDAAQPATENNNKPPVEAVLNGHADESKKDNEASVPVVNGTSDKGEEANTTNEGQQTTLAATNGPTAAPSEKPKEIESPAAMYKVTSPELSTKTSIRRIVWKYLDASGLVLFPRPCMYRIPRFQGENEAVEKLASLDVFKAAKIVKTNLDKSHERLRFEVISSGKELIVGAPGLREAVFYHMRPPLGSDEWRNHTAASRLGITSLASALIFNSETQADLIVLGSVAVDKKGRRVGKGDTFSDLEFAILSTLGAITPNATIVTVVHDDQVFEELPDSIFKNHDVPVDIIVTPTQVINVEQKLPHPVLLWNLLTMNRINEIPILKLLMDLEKSKGKSIVLKPNDPPAAIPSLMPRRKFYRNNRRPPVFDNYRAPFMPFMRHNGFINRSWSRGKAFMFHSRNVRRPQMSDGNNYHQHQNHQQQQHHQQQPHQQQQQRNRMTRQRQNSANNPRTQLHNDVIRVKGLNASVRIRTLKAALYTRGVRPSGISWRPKSGLAILYFNPEAAPMPVTMNGSSHASADELVTVLKGLSVNSDDGSILKLNFEASAAAN